MRGILVYTALRLGLLVVVWLAVQVVTPLRGLLAIAVALVVSGIIGYLVLDRSRDRASIAIDRFFRRIDARIEASRIAEDLPESGDDGAERESRAEEQAVGEEEQPGRLQDADEGSADGSR